MHDKRVVRGNTYAVNQVRKSLAWKDHCIVALHPLLKKDELDTAGNFRSAENDLSEGADAVQRGLHQRRRDPPAARLRPEARVADDKRRVAERKAAQEQDELHHGGALQLGRVREHGQEQLQWRSERLRDDGREVHGRQSKGWTT